MTLPCAGALLPSTGFYITGDAPACDGAPLFISSPPSDTSSRGIKSIRLPCYDRSSSQEFTSGTFARALPIHFLKPLEDARTRKPISAIPLSVEFLPEAADASRSFRLEICYDRKQNHAEEGSFPMSKKHLTNGNGASDSLDIASLSGHLWESANILRGAVDAADFKTYIFPLLFFKRISDVFDEEYSAMEKSGGDRSSPGFPKTTASRSRRGVTGVMSAPGARISGTPCKKPCAASNRPTPRRSTPSSATLGERERPVVHSDRGAHYRWPSWIERMERAGLTRSMSKKGCSPDNAACEGFFGRLKNEMFYNRKWQGVGIDEFMDILDNYLYWYNKKRIKISLGAKSPLEYRRDLDLAA